jgi:hypothetical protein
MRKTHPRKKRAGQKKSPSFERYLNASYSENTRMAYEKDVEHFRSWGGRVPATQATIARYLAAHAETLAYATLCRRLAAIHSAHVVAHAESPVRTDWYARP